jgi:5'-deoxynucleotidase YfbR-like HD superfamily hydrolase
MSKPTYIQTYSGTEFYALSPRAEDVKLIDIAHALSNKCRFAGHCRDFYSVAQHSVLVSRNCPDELKLWGLLHDAGEAYFADIPNPIKREFSLFADIERPIMAAVIEKFGLVQPPVDAEMPPEVKHADRVLLATEARDLLNVVWHDWEELWKPLALDTKIEALPPQDAKMFFIAEYNKLTKSTFLHLSDVK